MIKFNEIAAVSTYSKTGVRTTSILHSDHGLDELENLTKPEGGLMLEGVLAVECYLEPEKARSLQSDAKVLLVDSTEDLRHCRLSNDTLRRVSVHR